MYESINVFHPFIIGEVLCGMLGGIPTLLGMTFAVVSDDSRADKGFVSVIILKIQNFNKKFFFKNLLIS